MEIDQIKYFKAGEDEPTSDLHKPSTGLRKDQ